MNDVALQKQIDELTKQTRLSAELTEERMLSLRAEIDRLNRKVAALAECMASEIPAFREHFEQILARRSRALDPEEAGAEVSADDG